MSLQNSSDCEQSGRPLWMQQTGWSGVQQVNSLAVEQQVKVQVQLTPCVQEVLRAATGSGTEESDPPTRAAPNKLSALRRERSPEAMPRVSASKERALGALAILPDLSCSGSYSLTLIS